MNYKQIYEQLIDKAKNREIIGYTEKHHILPRSMGGTNDKSNLVKLTAKEHYVAHMLLWKIYKNGSMAQAVWLISYVDNHKINSRTFEILRKDYAAAVSKIHKGKIYNEQTRQKMSISKMGKISPMKGKSFNLTDEEIKIRSESRKGKYAGEINHMKTDAHRQRQRDLCNSPEAKQKFIERMTGHRPYHFRQVSAHGVEYESAAQCSRALNVTYNWLMRRLTMDKYPDYFYIT